MEFTNPACDILAVIDADYVIRPNWLIDLVPIFDDAKVALVQAPQDHRDADESLLKLRMQSMQAFLISEWLRETKRMPSLHMERCSWYAKVRLMR